jgi:hypothetical protein
VLCKKSALKKQKPFYKIYRNGFWSWIHCELAALRRWLFIADDS